MPKLPKEKLITISAGAVVGAFVLYIAVDAVLLGPLKKQTVRAATLRNEINKAQDDLRMLKSKASRWPALAAATLGSDENVVREEVRSRLLALLERSGLTSNNLGIDPVTGASPRGFYQEIGGSVSASGRMEHVIDFMYLLKAEPLVQRVDNVSIRPTSTPGEMSLRLKYSTLALKAPPGVSLSASMPASATGADLDGDGRRQYALIAARDIFRPYVKRPPEPIVAPQPVVTQEAPPQPQYTPPAPQQRVVGLPTMGGQPEVNIAEYGSVRTCQVGDQLAGGTITMVDYRPMPRQDNPELLSDCRVIVQIGSDYWAIEIGQDISQKRRLKSDELPSSLVSVEPQAPAQDAEDAQEDAQAPTSEQPDAAAVDAAESAG